ncbi:hypothetical protein F0562_020239 [Nyssa sinensis]|uniref:Uncharacterized protein n=1 Tax=Nyssa sinensis TaxID=561372 RepID=A0A5J5BR52_9ASTE|nr:hypothetical protein F0562_020239 [Nyssa sinensis]
MMVINRIMDLMMVISEIMKGNSTALVVIGRDRSVAMGVVEEEVVGEEVNQMKIMDLEMRVKLLRQSIVKKTVVGAEKNALATSVVSKAAECKRKKLDQVTAQYNLKNKTQEEEEEEYNEITLEEYEKLLIEKKEGFGSLKRQERKSILDKDF